MIIEYHRPQTLEEALALLARPQPPTYPLGGGTVLSQPDAAKYAVVDLQAVGLSQIERQGNQLVIGAAATLQDLFACDDIQPALREAIRKETNFNLRQTASVAGGLVTASGNSPFAVAMMSLDAKIIWAPGTKEISLGDYLSLRNGQKPGLLIIQVVIPLNVGLQYDFVARTPADQPLICAAVAKWSSSRTRVVLGGPGESPILVLDGQNGLGAGDAAENAYSHLPNNQISNLNYFKETSRALVERLLTEQVSY